MELRPDVPGYHLCEPIATGSTATVWAAGAEPGADDLAVKVIPVDRHVDPTDLALELSALAMSAGSGEHLVRVVDVVSVLTPEPAVAVVMERLRHGTLAGLVRTRGHLLAGEVVTLLTPLAVTLAGLHDAAVVHGDLSPSNVGLAADGRPVLLDLGVSAVVGTPREDVYGTPGFVAPEVVSGGGPTPAADVYAVGSIGWFALTGEPPPVPAERPALVEVAPVVPDTLAEVLERALHPDPELRPSARELGTAVYAAAPARPVRPGDARQDPATMLTQRVRDLARAAVDGDADRLSQTRAGRRADLRRRSRAMHLRVVAAVAAMLLLGGAGVAVASAQRGTPAPPTAPGGSSVSTVVAAPAGAGGSDTAPGERIEGVVNRLVQARADAWNGADPGRLVDCFADGSTAHEHDRGVLAAALAEGHRYEGVAFSAEQVDVLSETVDRVSLEVTLTTGPYAVLTTADRRTREASVARVRLSLVRVGGEDAAGRDGTGASARDEWRIEQVIAAQT